MALTNAAVSEFVKAGGCRIGRGCVARERFRPLFFLKTKRTGRVDFAPSDFRGMYWICL
jgi:hypothetical protein